MYTFWAFFLTIALSDGSSINQRMDFVTPATCAEVQAVITDAGFDATPCFDVTVWSRVSPDGYTYE
jgi:hypothetical protein